MIGRNDIERLAELSRIKLSPEEAEALTKDIDAILGYVGQIGEVSGAIGDRPEAGAVRNVMREDAEPHETEMFSDILLAEAPSREGNYFKVKKILGGNGVS